MQLPGGGPPKTKAKDYNPYHKGPGEGGGQFTSGEESGAGKSDEKMAKAIEAAKPETEPAQPGYGGTYGLVAGDREKFEDLSKQWSGLNNQLLSEINDPAGPKAQALSRQMEQVVQEIHTLHADPGTPEGIGLPGGPRDVTIVGAGPGGMESAIMGGAEGLDTLLVEGNVVPGGQAKFSSRIENFPGFPVGVAGEKLTQDMFKQAQRLGAETKLGTKVTHLHVDEKTGMKTLTLPRARKNISLASSPA